MGKKAHLLFIVCTLWCAGILIAQRGAPILGSQQTQSFDIQSLVKSGKYSSQQLEQMGRLNGMSEMQIRGALNNSNSADGSFDQGLSSRSANGVQDPSRMNGKADLGSSGSTSSIFGLDFFKQQRGFQQPSQNIATPDLYVLGAGDVLSVVVYGTSQQTYQLPISKEGTVLIPFVGPVQLQGLSVAAARSKLKRSLSKIYAGMTGANPTVFLELSLQNIRSIQVQLVGEVERPGSYLIPSFSTIFNLLVRGGGPTEIGTLRNIKVYRGGNEIAVFDAYQVLIFGNASQDVQLADGDVIVVGTFDARVEVKGEVRRPAIFEVLESDRAEDIIRFAGNFTKDAFKESIAVQQTGGADQRAYEISLQDADYIFGDGDILTVWTNRDIQIEQVQVEGAVQRPGPYAWTDEMTVENLIEKAGGLLPDASMSGVTIYSQSKALLPSINQVEKDSMAIMQRILQPGDLISIPSFFELDEYQYVQVQGDVYATGLFPYFQDQSLADLLVLTGGIKNSAYGGQIEIARLKDKVSGYDLFTYDIPSDQEGLYGGSLSNVVLKPFDQIAVRSISSRGQSVRVQLQGEVLYPGEYMISEQLTTVSKVIERAGGFTKDAYPEGATLLRRNENFQPKDSQEDRLNRLLALRKNIENLDVLNQSLNPRVLIALDNQITNLSQQIYNQRQTQLEERDRKLINALDTAIINQSLSSSFKVGRVVKTPINVTFAKEQQEQMTNSSNSYDKVGIKLAEIMENPGGPEDIILLPGDQIIIPRLEQTIRIRGAILYPTTVKYAESKGFKSYISQAGGFSLQAKPGRSYVIYPNGEASRTKRFLFFRFWPEIKPGTQIVVANGRIRNQFSLERILTLTTSVVTTYLLVNSVVTQSTTN
jgi:protein involved in polysaccharide export with SLBB domain